MADPEFYQRGANYWVADQSSGNRIVPVLIHPSGWMGREDLPVLVLVPGGSRDSTGFLKPPRYTISNVVNAGYLVVVFDLYGRDKSEGQEGYNGIIHQYGLADVIRFASCLPEAKNGRVGLVSSDFGVIMASGSLARHPDLPVAFLMGWEGPADRNGTGGCDEYHTGHLQEVVDCSDEVFWEEHDALAFITRIDVPFQRLQSDKDHAQPEDDHAIAMIHSAIVGGVPWVRLNDLPANLTFDIQN